MSRNTREKYQLLVELMLSKFLHSVRPTMPYLDPFVGKTSDLNGNKTSTGKGRLDPLLSSSACKPTVFGN